MIVFILPFCLFLLPERDVSNFLNFSNLVFYFSTFMFVMFIFFSSKAVDARYGVLCCAALFDAERSFFTFDRNSLLYRLPLEPYLPTLTLFLILLLCVYFTYFYYYYYLLPWDSHISTSSSFIPFPILFPLVFFLSFFFNGFCWFDRGNR